MKDEACCEICGKTAAHGVVLVAMQPGADGKDWWLCIRDYIDGLFPGKLGRIDPKYRDVVTAVPTPTRKTA